MSTKNTNVKVYIQISFLIMFMVSILIVAFAAKPDDNAPEPATEKTAWVTLEQIAAQDAALLRELEALRAQPTEKNEARREQLEIQFAQPLTTQQKSELTALTKLVMSKKASAIEETRCYKLIMQENYAALKVLSER